LSNLVDCVMNKPSLLVLMCVLAGCQANPTLSDDSTPVAVTGGDEEASGPGRVLFFGEALWAEPVFDRDVQLVKRAISDRYDSLTDSVTLSMTKGSAKRSSADAEIARLAQDARDGDDLVVVFFSSHGIEGSLAVQPPGAAESYDWSAAEIRDFLAPLEADRQVVILQACHSGSLIPAMKHPNRIIIAAARADRSSFGCDATGDSTWFAKALTEELSAGGSWKQIFERTNARVLRYETDQGIPQSERSYPQFSVGAAMQDVWTGANDPE
jgi:hypothetical protein